MFAQSDGSGLGLDVFTQSNVWTLIEVATLGLSVLTAAVFTLAVSVVWK
jgi:hypothetical protein